LLQSGADYVIAEESEVALAMAETILRDLGATAEQIDQQRAKLRSELHQDPQAPKPSSSSKDAP
jgi:CPA2 family monovalent cation:H+ antiporter-2